MAKQFIEDDVDAQLVRNESLLEVIRDHGADLDERRPIDFFFYAGDRAVAVDFAAELKKLGFNEIQVAEEAVDGTWSVQAVKLDSVNTITAPAFVESIVRLAAQYLVEFDGWGTSI
jgi:regulator of RNase E activity RraB